MALKDFKWVERDGRNRVVNTPIGAGTVDFVEFFRFLKQQAIQAPFTMHLEYPVGGAENGARELGGPPEVVYRALGEDLAAIRRLWAEAGLRVLPGAYLSHDGSGADGGNPGSSYIRLALVHDLETLEDALGRLVKVL